MKKVLILSLTLFYSALWAQTTSLAGKITESETGEEFIAANIIVYQNGVMVTGASTDFEGNYSISLDPGTYDVEVSYIGYQTERITGVIVRAGQANKLDVQLGADIILDEIVVTGFKVPLIQQDNTTQGGIKKAEEIAKLPKKNINALAARSAGISVGDTKTAAEIAKLPQSGQLTAGEWKDLDNWSFWDELMKDEQFAKYRDYWDFYPDDRFELKLSDEKSRPLANLKVNLLNADQKVVWSSISDNKGSVCLWGNFYGAQDEGFVIQVLTDEGEHRLPAIPYTDGLNNLQLEANCTSSNKVDVAFVIDVSGSMHDEIDYLKSELKDVIQRAETEENPLEIRTGAVYYSGRNEGEYLNSSPLTRDNETTLKFMATSPLGGGNFEAVNLGLGKAVDELDWNSEAVARIVFVLLDEPPLHDQRVLDDTHRVIQEAAKKGIKVIPVAASGTKKDLEFLLKFFAMGTNSTYTFLTNHSGIGDNHIEPEAGSYNVETLNDLMVRLIIENSEYHDCETTTSITPEVLKSKKAFRKVKRKKANKKIAKQINIFPNPARDYVNIDLEKAVDVLLISTLDGQVVAQYPKVEAGQIRIQTTGWAAGTYLLQFWTKEGHGVLKLVVSGDT